VSSYHVRVHYRTANKNGRRVSWFRYIRADTEAEAGNKAIQRVVGRKTNSGVVEVDTVEVREVEAKRDPVKAERYRIAKWLAKHGYRQLADAVAKGDHLKC